jgi:hypothetical protein
MLIMIRLLAAGGLLATAAVLPASASSSQYSAAAMLGFEVYQQRKDVEEVAIPEPPSGPATPIPFCSPGSPVCP